MIEACCLDTLADILLSVRNMGLMIIGFVFPRLWYREQSQSSAPGQWYVVAVGK